MIRKILLLVSLTLALDTRAATVTGDIRDIYGAAYSPRARFIPKSTPLADGNQTVLDVPRSADLVNGLFTVTLKGGLYDVDFGPPNKPIRIFVPPNDSSTYTLNDVAAMATNTTLFTVGNPIARKLESTNGVAYGLALATAPTLGDHAVSKAYVDALVESARTDTNALQLTGGGVQTVEGEVVITDTLSAAGLVADVIEASKLTSGGTIRFPDVAGGSGVRLLGIDANGALSASAVTPDDVSQEAIESVVAQHGGTLFLPLEISPNIPLKDGQNNFSGSNYFGANVAVNGAVSVGHAQIKAITPTQSLTIGNNNTNNSLMATLVGNNNSSAGGLSDYGAVLGNHNKLLAGDFPGVLGYNNTIQQDYAFAVGMNLTNGTLGTVDIGITDATKVTFGMDQYTFRAPTNHFTGNVGVAGGVTAQSFTGDGVGLTNIILRESSGPDTLGLGAIADGQFLARSGASIIGVAAPDGGTDTNAVRAIGDDRYVQLNQPINIEASESEYDAMDIRVTTYEDVAEQRRFADARLYVNPRDEETIAKLTLFSHDEDLPFSSAAVISAAQAGGFLTLSDAEGSTSILLDGGSGSVSASSFTGNGSGLTDLDASALTSGLVSIERLATATNIVLLPQSVNFLGARSTTPSPLFVQAGIRLQNLNDGIMFQVPVWVTNMTATFLIQWSGTGTLRLTNSWRSFYYGEFGRSWGGTAVVSDLTNHLNRVTVNYTWPLTNAIKEATFAVGTATTNSAQAWLLKGIATLEGPVSIETTP